MTASSCDRSAAVSRRGTCATCRRWFAASPGISTPARPERHGLVTLLFEIDHDLVAVAAFQRYSEHTGEIVPIALATAHQGARLRPDGRPLAVAVLDETLRQMADAGY